MLLSAVASWSNKQSRLGQIKIFIASLWWQPFCVLICRHRSIGQVSRWQHWSLLHKLHISYNNKLSVRLTALRWILYLARVHRVTEHCITCQIIWLFNWLQ